MVSIISCEGLPRWLLRNPGYILLKDEQNRNNNKKTGKLLQSTIELNHSQLEQVSRKHYLSSFFFSLKKAKDSKAKILRLANKVTVSSNNRK